MRDVMKAAMLHGPGDLRLEEVPAFEPAADQALVRIRACGICPSDVRTFTGQRKALPYPRIFGHEWAGEIVTPSRGSTEFEQGDPVVADWRAVCGQCFQCRRGMANYCENMNRDDVRGGFCESGVATAANLRAIPNSVGFAQAAFTEPVACCLNGIARNRIQPGHDVLVVGCGPIGLLHVQIAKHLGARVIACDLIAERRDAACSLGAKAAVDPKDGDPAEAVRALTDGRGPDAVIVAVGAPDAIQFGLGVAAVGGSVNLFAGTYPPTAIDVDPNLIHYKVLSVVGSHDFTPHDFTTALKMIADHTVRVEPLISHRLSLEQLEDGFGIVSEQRGLKVMMEIDP